MKNNKINEKCLEDEESVDESVEEQEVEFDQIVKGNVEIKKLKSKYKYRVTFSKIGKFLLYQVWNKDSKKLNDERLVLYVKAKDWVNAFNEEDDNEIPFTPTTIMETEDGKVYAFVIHEADFDRNGCVYFTVSTKEIKVQDKDSSLVNLPLGKHKNMRFDIDAYAVGGGRPRRSKSDTLKSYAGLLGLDPDTIKKIAGVANFFTPPADTQTG